MAWSTRQLAELAGTTVKTVRHYHETGLLDEPERTSNGYKQYGVEHLVRVLRIKRLSDLGVPLAQIATLGEGGTQSEDALRIIDAELAGTIDRLQRVRAELQMILRHQAPIDLPPGFAEGSSLLSDADRAILLIYSRVLTPGIMEDLREMSSDDRRDPVDTEFDDLSPDADEETRQRLAERYAPTMRELTDTYPWISDLGTQSPHGEELVVDVLGEAILTLYNPAQIDVMRRSHEILQAEAAAESPEPRADETEHTAREVPR
ncbi:MerR family transcriptional regulator [Sanguibacter sp. 25GB23B1]|uniref:helix-turn-helix domain-containing protein n=1 Tax=unclassified Sanguibacter TaxID=2645534 RepID=UPI0032AF6E1B